jgi:plastocyanin
VLTRIRRLAPSVAIAAAALASCGSEAAIVPVQSTAYVITILNYTVDPADLRVPPGTTVLVQNHDPFDHWLRSEAAPGAYTFAAVGGVGIDLYVDESSVRAFVVPATAVVGTVVPYYCQIAQNAMLNQGQLTIVAPGTAASAPSGTAPAR